MAISPKGADREIALPDDKKLLFHVSDCADPCVLKFCSLRDGRWQSTLDEFEYRMPALCGKDLTEDDIRSAMETGLAIMDRHYRQAAKSAAALADAITSARNAFSPGEGGWHAGPKTDPRLEQEKRLSGRKALLTRRSAEKPWTLAWPDGSGRLCSAESRTVLGPVEAQGWADEKLAEWSAGGKESE